MRLVVLRLKRCGAAESPGCFLGLAQPHERGAAVEVSRHERGIGLKRILKKPDGDPVLTLSRDNDAQVVRDARVSRNDAQRRAIRIFSLRQPPALEMGHGAGNKCAKFSRYLLRQALLPPPTLPCTEIGK